MSIIQALKDVTARLEAYDAQIKSSSSVPPAKAEEMRTETEKMDMVFRQAQFFIDRPHLCGKHEHLEDSLVEAQDVYGRVVAVLKSCDKNPEQTPRALMKRRFEEIKDFSIPQQPSKMPRIEMSMLNLPPSIWLKIIGLLGNESRFVLRHVCKPFKEAIQLKRLRDPVQESALVRIDTPIDFCDNAAHHGYMNLLQWARKGPHIIKWTALTCSSAAENGHFEILKWLRANGCPWDAQTCDSAAFNGHLEILKWLRANGCPWNVSTCSGAAVNGHLETLKWARENGCPWDEVTCFCAAAYGYLTTLQWARANGCPWDEKTCSSAAENGHLETLKWARANGCPWDENTCAKAAENGHLETLKWARANGCPWGKETCFSAAENGHLETLKWLRANGCPWDERTCAKAAENGQLETLQWLKENGAPWNEESIRRNSKGHAAVLKWLDAKKS